MGSNIGITCGCCKDDNPISNSNHNESRIDYDLNDHIATMKKDLSSKGSVVKTSSNISFIVIQSFFRQYCIKKKFELMLNKKIQLFDSNIIQYGKYISDEEMNNRMTIVKQIENEKRLKPFRLSDKERKAFNLIFVKKAFCFNDNTIYKGSWNYLGKKHGYGIFIQESGSMYEGLWENDAMSGRGRYIDIKRNMYEGYWSKGKAQGKGTLTLSDGYQYEGEWKEDVQDGYGKEIFSDGSSYEGYYALGHKEGEGKFNWSDGSVYEGTFANSVINGKGTFKWKDGRKYTGQWIDNKMNGYGVFEWPNGKKYEGEYVQNQKEGKGTYYWNTNTYYTGCWMHNSQHGEGEFHHDGIITKGIFRFGKFAKNNEIQTKNAIPTTNKTNNKPKVTFNPNEIMNESNNEINEKNDVIIPQVKESFRLSN